MWFQRFKYLTLSLIPPTTVLVIHLIRYQIRPDLPILDVVAHFFGGLAIAWMGIILVRGLRDINDIPPETPHWLTDYAVLGTVFIAGVLWEFMEWGADTFLGTHSQFTIPETMGDLLMDFLGGLLFLLIVVAIRFFNKTTRLHKS